MSVKLPPNGTRGVVIPKFVLPLMKAGMKLSYFVFRMLGDRMKIQGQQLVMLTTIGAKTGRRRHAILARFPDPARSGTWLVIGSNGGAKRHPSWCYNLAENPERVWIKTGNEVLQVRPDSLHGAVREEAWRRVVSVAPVYGRYETATDREIPIIRLTPDSTGAELTVFSGERDI